MNGMTGYGRHEQSSERYRISAELRSYNSRYLELNVSVPPALGELEQRIRQKLDANLARGRVEAQLRVAAAEAAVEVEVNGPLAAAYRRALWQLAEPLGQAVTVDHLLSVGGLLRECRPQDTEGVWEEAEPAVDTAMAQLLASRRVEGEAAEADVRSQLAQLTGELDTIQRDTASYADATATARARDAAARARELLTSDADDERVVAALASLLVRADINEELVRARGHLVALEAALTEDGTGKHMEFLCQEVLREVNTIASKSAAYGVAAAAVRAKGCLERMREQLRNVE